MKRLMYKLDKSGDIGEPCGIPHWLSRIFLLLVLPTIAKSVAGRLPHLNIVGSAMPLGKLSHPSNHFGREIYIQSDGVTPMAMGGNKP